jgi:hypothetical protein
MISKTKPKNLERAEIVELRKGLPLQYLNGKYLVDMKEKRWQSFFIVTMFKAIVRKFEIMNDFEMNRVLDYLLMSTSTQDEVVKELNKHIGKYVTFFTGSGNQLVTSDDITMPGVTDLRKGVKDSASTLENNLKKLAK